MTLIILKDYAPELSLDKIEIAPENVRKTRPKTGLQDLKSNIEKYGLIQPIIVIQKGSRYKLVVGQRRYLAFKELGRTTIPALIIKAVDSTTQTIVSFGENLQRKKLPYEDTIRVCDLLYKEYRGSPPEKIKKISKNLGISIHQVSKYIAYRLVPREVQKLVTQGKLTEDAAYRITTGHFPNIKKIISIANYAIKMTTSEWQRAADYGKKKPNASVNEVLDYAKNPPLFIEIKIQIEPETKKLLEKRARNEHKTIASIVNDAIDLYLEV